MMGRSPFLGSDPGLIRSHTMRSVDVDSLHGDAELVVDEFDDELAVS